MRRHLTLAVLVLAIGGVTAHWLSGIQRESPRRVAGHVVRHGGVQLEAPRSWRRAPASPDAPGAATWTAPDRSQSLTIGVIPTTDAPLDALALGSRTELARTVPGYVYDSSHAARYADGTPGHVVRFRARVAGQHLLVVQAWRRDERAGNDIIVTWTRAEQATGSEPDLTTLTTTPEGR